MSNEGQSPDTELQDRIRSLQAPLPDPAYKERNRKFFTGRIRYDSEEDQRFQPVFSRGWLWSGAGVAAAAALAVIFVMTSGGPRWEVWDVPGEESIHVNGEEVRIDTPESRNLSSSSRVRGSEAGFITLGVEHEVSLVLAPRTEVTLGSSRSILGREVLRASVLEGTAWGSTGPDFPERGLWIETDHARIHISGTTFSVVSGGDSTCVCVLTGEVDVECKLTGETQTVAPNQRLYLSSKGVDARRLSPLTPAQQERLSTIREEASRAF